MGLSQRQKGRVGQTTAGKMFRDRGWQTDPISAGVRREDLIATDLRGQQWSVEVKNTATITQAHRKQAIEQAAKRKLPWMLMNKIAGTRHWLIQMKGRSPTIWVEFQEDLL